MKAKKLLGAKYPMYKGKDFMSMIETVVEGTIEPKSTYIQSSSKFEFCTIGCSPDAKIRTILDEIKYLYKVD